MKKFLPLLAALAIVGCAEDAAETETPIVEEPAEVVTTPADDAMMDTTGAMMDTTMTEGEMMADTTDAM